MRINVALFKLARFAIFIPSKALIAHIMSFFIISQQFWKNSAV
uniref:Uncharacterized protein n=1 Tax=Triticum urartu TaxID=4572 RepID=A0A8R7JWC1_TRIUA